MKKMFCFLALLAAILFASGCALTDITENANDTLKEAEDLLREIDKQLETGKITQDIADKAKDVINSVIQTISDKLQENAGFIFNNVNQTLDNTFYNLTNLIITLKTEIIGGSAMDLIEASASQIRLTITQLSGELQDIVLLVSGQLFIFLDKTVNFVIILICIILLAIGLIVFVIIFLLKKGDLTPGPIVALVLIGIYVLFFLSVVLITPLRGWIIAGFDFGSKVTPKVLVPKVVGIYPEKFMPGVDNKIYIYGRHLNLIKKLNVKLQQGSVVKKTFPESSIIVSNYSQILLGNLDTAAAGFQYLDYNMLKSKVIDIDPVLQASGQIDLILNTKADKTFDTSRNFFIRTALPDSIRSATTLSAGSFIQPEFDVVQPRLMLAPTVITSSSILESAAALRLFDKTKLFQGSSWNIAEGLYGLFVYDDAVQVEDEAAIQIDFPDPPAPKPDLTVVGLSFAGEPVIGKNVTPKLVLGFTDYKEIKKDFFVRIHSIVPAGYDIQNMVKQADIASIPSNGILTLYLSPYKINSGGTHQFEVFTDSKNDIEEKSEANNKGVFSVTALQYKYDVTVAIQNFKPKKSYDDSEDEYEIRISMYLNSGSKWDASISKDGEPSNNWSVGITHAYGNVSPGDSIYVYASGFEDDGDHWYDRNDDMGAASDNYTIQDTGAVNTKTQTLILNADGFELRGQYTVTRSVVP